MNRPDPHSDFSEWIGRSTSASDVITQRMARSLSAVLDRDELFQFDDDVAPYGIHWCLCPVIAKRSDLRPDGHPHKSDILPPVPMPHRMFAGSQSDFIQPLHVGDKITRISTLKQITRKEGRSGPLCFLQVAHEYFTERGVALKEAQDIVLRTTRAAPSAPERAIGIPTSAQRRESTIDSIRLFQYSALTFNSHRIHLDRAYAVEQEHLVGLIVQSPLLATMLLQFAASLKNSACPTSFGFRSTSPLLEGETVTLIATETSGGISLQAIGETNGVCMTANARW